MRRTRKNAKYLFSASFTISMVALFYVLSSHALPPSSELEDIISRISALTPDPAHRDDIYGIIVVQDAVKSLKEGSGGIGACLVNEITGEVVARGRNRQYTPYFRSDLHAEMDLLNRYEDWLIKQGGASSNVNPRDCKNLVLISSVEPCPMCLTRIINAGIKKMYYVVPDEKGGMVSRIKNLPPFWREIAETADYRMADCSTDIQQIARELFSYSMRVWAKKKKKLAK